MQAWTAKYVRKNLWRVSHLGDFEDAMQEAYIVFDRCARTYTGKVDNPAWFMSLYQRSITAQFNDFSTKSTRSRVVTLAADMANEDDELPVQLAEPVGELSNAGELMTMLRQAPSEIKTVLAVLLNAPSELLELIASAFNTGTRGRAASNQHLCMLIGVTEEQDLLGQVQEYFG